MEVFIAFAIFVDTAILVYCLGYWVEALANGTHGSDNISMGWSNCRQGWFWIPVKNTIQKALIQAARWSPGSRAERRRIKQELVQAGHRQDLALPLFYGVSALLIAVLPSLSSLYLLAARQAGRPSYPEIFLIACGAAILGYLLPRWALRLKRRRRQERLRLELPLALDLMIIGVEAGLGLDQALQKVSVHLRRSGPDIGGEFEWVLLELRAGQPRAEAFRNLAARTGVQEIHALVSAMIQTDQFGGSLADSLRLYAEELRTRRRQRAEEMAAKIPVKLVFPIFFFIFPAIFAVTAAPAIIRVVRELGPIVRG